MGLTAVDASGTVLGRVEELWNTGEVPNLVIRAEGREELVVPFAEDFVSTVDVVAGRIVIKPPEYLEAHGGPEDGPPGDGPEGEA